MLDYERIMMERNLHYSANHKYRVLNKVDFFLLHKEYRKDAPNFMLSFVRFCQRELNRIQKSFHYRHKPLIDRFGMTGVVWIIDVRFRSSVECVIALRVRILARDVLLFNMFI